MQVTIENFPSKEGIQLDVPDFPAEPERGSHTVSFTEVIYIERDDFREVQLLFIHSNVLGFQITINYYKNHTQNTFHISFSEGFWR